MLEPMVVSRPAEPCLEISFSKPTFMGVGISAGLLSTAVCCLRAAQLIIMMPRMMPPTRPKVAVVVATPWLTEA